MKKLLVLLIAIAWTSSSCEKDDICDQNTQTTPSVVVSFYDAANPSVEKAVTNLAIIGDGASQYIAVNGSSRVKVPLRTTATATNYRFILNYDAANPASGNTDKLAFSYAKSDIFISRACGFKTVFVLDSNTPALTDGDTADGLWIQDIIVSQPNILTENEIHLKIYF